MSTSTSVRSGALRVTLKYPKSRLGRYEPSIARVLGKPLPDEVRQQYERGDGLLYRCEADSGEEVTGEVAMVGLEAMFGGARKGAFRAHTPLKSIDVIDDDVMPDQPFYEEFFSEEFELESRKDLARLNALKRHKLLVNIPGESAYLAIDYLDPKRQPYQISLLQDCCELYPLDLTFPDFVRHFSQFGATHWYLAFVGKKAGATMNIDLASEVAASLKVFREHGAHEDDVAALMARAKAR